MRTKNYEENERSIKPKGMYLRKLERRYMEEQKEIEKMNQTQQPPWFVNNMKEKHIRGMTTTESSTSYNINKNTVIT